MYILGLFPNAINACSKQFKDIRNSPKTSEIQMPTYAGKHLKISGQPSGLKYRISTVLDWAVMLGNVPLCFYAQRKHGKSLHVCLEGKGHGW